MSITGTLSAAISGLNADSVRVNVAAHNIATARTADYQPLQVTAKTLTTQQNTTTDYASGGVLVSVSPTLGEGVNMVREITNMMQAHVSYKANASLIRHVEDMAKTVIDIKA